MSPQDERRALQKMVQHGVRLTAQRRRMVDIFAHSTRTISPRELYDHMHAHHPGLSFDTVYRNIRLLCDIGVLESFGHGDKVRYRLGCGHEHHHHHFQCIRCEQTTVISFCPLEMVRLPENTRIVRHVFELHGVCAQCNDADERCTTECCPL
ncbi:MAG: transcriptional repressor [Paenibacillaceae bacterium]|jgi:Fur family zinc uptake transcriptional regulator|nr:transcriptional repressor [Paenibacillaceae bacterium]